ncbi:hypothetical protein L1049_012431 [Liquidambar formosana]|uniref:beta-galactosidase n=1 Tax=Liquidambar formosana TaxID=63359 RepID=A0AAP0N5W1_LIQFO
MARLETALHRSPPPHPLAPTLEIYIGVCIFFENARLSIQQSCTNIVGLVKLQRAEGNQFEVLEMVWWLLCWALLLVLTTKIRRGEVTYDGWSIIIDGQRKILFSGSPSHYPRSTPQYDFSGGYDLVNFIKEIEAQELYACLRIGPFIESEWTHGWLPFWLHDVRRIIYRSDNEPFKFYMQNFTTKIVNLMKSEGLYASQGGPIILSQIENEYHNIEAAFHEKGPPYVCWVAKMTVELQTGVPWVMCKQSDAPDPVINTCNGMKCEKLLWDPTPRISHQSGQRIGHLCMLSPNLYTYIRMVVVDMVSLVKPQWRECRWWQQSGICCGSCATRGPNLSRGMVVPLDGDKGGLIRQPKWGHLKDLHAAVKSCSTPLLQGVQTNFSLGQLQEAYVFQEDTGGCVAFLLNNDERNNATVQFNNISVELLPKSMSIMKD